MGYEALTDRMMKGLQTWLVLLAAALAWLFGGSFRATLAAGREWISPTPESTHVDAAVERVHEETEALLASLEPEPHVRVVRRFLDGEMTSDIGVLGKARSRRLITLRAMGIDVSRISDARLMEIVNGRDPGALDRRVERRVEEALVLDEEHVGYGI